MSLNITVEELLSLVHSRADFPIVETVLFCITSFVGTIGNAAICLIVCLRPRLRIARNVFLTNLALINLLTAATLMLFIYAPFVLRRWPYGDFSCKMMGAFTGTNVFSSALTIMAIAVDRYVCVKQTLPDGGKGSMQRTIMKCLAIWTGSFVLAIPFGYFHETKPITVPISSFVKQANVVIIENPGNITGIAFPAICSYTPPFVAKIILAALQVLFMFCLPFVTVLMFSIAVHHKLRLRTFRLSALQRRDRIGYENRRIVTLLSSMGAAFGLLWCPLTVFTILDDFFHEFLLRGANATLWDLRLQWLAYCSVCVNPFLYGFLNQNFKREFRTIFRRAGRNTETPESTYRRRDRSKSRVVGRTSV